jgi:two-component system chemotaxis response regulator CheB
MWEFQNGAGRRYERLVGHRCSLDSLLEAQGEEVESALWAALRMLEERIHLQKRLAAAESQAAGRRGGRQLFQAKAAENLKHARLLRQVLEKNRELEIKKAAIAGGFRRFNS